MFCVISAYSQKVSTTGNNSPAVISKNPVNITYSNLDDIFTIDTLSSAKKEVIDTVDALVLAVDWEKLEKGLIFRKAIRKGHTEILYRYDSMHSNTGLNSGNYIGSPTIIWHEIKYYQVIFGEWEDVTKYVVQSWFKDK